MSRFKITQTLVSEYSYNRTMEPKVGTQIENGTLVFYFATTVLLEREQLRRETWRRMVKREDERKGAKMTNLVSNFNLKSLT